MTTAREIVVERGELFRRGALRPYVWTYAATGPDGRQFTNNSIVTLRQRLREVYPGVVVVEPWKAA